MASPEERFAYAKGIYADGLAKVKTTPVPKDQKYPPGTRVSIRGGGQATVRYTYAHAYGGYDVKSYSLLFDSGCSSAWFQEEDLTPVV